MRWVWRGITGGTLVLGWVFILWQNNFRLTVPVVVIALGYLAVVATIANLWRIGASAVAPEDESRDAWARPIGARGELEKEKKTLLKAIKEAEFDLAMGKLSKVDADELTRTYRTRAIAVIREIDRLDAGAVGSAREQIQREVQARLAIDAVPAKTKARADAKSKGGGKAEAKSKGDGTAKADAAAKAATKADAKAELVPVVETNPVDTNPVETDPVKTPEVETDPVHATADDNSPEDIAAEAATPSTKTTEATS
jgi:hypothetical protein